MVVISNYGFWLWKKKNNWILSGGIVIRCCFDAEVIISLGNIFEDNLNNILNSSRTIKMIDNFRKNKRIEELCKHCSFKKM